MWITEDKKINSMLYEGPQVDIKKLNREIQEKLNAQRNIRIDPEVEKLENMMSYEEYCDASAYEFEKCERFVMSEAVAKLLEQEYTKAKYAR